MANITIMWDDESTSAITDVREWAPQPYKAPTERIDSTGRPIYVAPANRPYITHLSFSIPGHECSATVVNNFVSHNRDITDRVTIFEAYTYTVFKGIPIAIPADFYSRLFPTQNLRFQISIGVTQEGTYTGTAGPSASISWRN